MLVKHCKDVVTKLHFKSHLIEKELQKKKAGEVAEDLEKILVAHQLIKCENFSPIDSIYEPESEQSSANALPSYQNLQQEVITLWNSLLEMLSSLVRLKIK